MTKDTNDNGIADGSVDPDIAPTPPDEDAEKDDDPQGMKGQLDDSMDGLEEGDDVGEASRGIPQD
ncbi:hypothetical protein H4J02_01275 [Protaetiibacter sp. SSC-01]|uniref:hypothetical protein n=1 Tax=Protaetiibacter sp. SSC-01 TaxID=2759943 RepID=UPI0016576586|nr:hypothetical protein [Protaetiibacter sp. SSC-01]QNO37707.1 hypothetical protein H4J02_01275 [Protaetiibacter sp. SSC-01]